VKETATEQPDTSPLQIALLKEWMQLNLNEQLRLNGRWTTREQVSDAVAD